MLASKTKKRFHTDDFLIEQGSFTTWSVTQPCCFLYCLHGEISPFEQVLIIIARVEQLVITSTKQD